jgi:hypothetical protein
MKTTDVRRQPASQDVRLNRDDYNFQHFRTKHLLSDMQATLERRGVPPGAAAPEFELPRVDGVPVRLSELRGRPALLHFGSFT